MPTVQKPFRNLHAARLVDPDTVDSFRTEQNAFGSGIHALFGIKDGKSVLASIRFDADQFTPAEAKAWLASHGHTPTKFEPATKRHGDDPKSKPYKKRCSLCGKSAVMRVTTMRDKRMSLCQRCLERVVTLDKQIRMANLGVAVKAQADAPNYRKVEGEEGSNVSGDAVQKCTNCFFAQNVDTTVEKQLGVAAQTTEGLSETSSTASTVTTDLQIITKAEKTHFPNRGDDQKILLSNSKYKQFDHDFASKLKANYPSIWKKAGTGGNPPTSFTGDDAFRKWTAYRKGERSESVLAWVKRRERYGNRHFRNTKLNGTIADIKWGLVNQLGMSKMKALINEEKRKVDARVAKSMMLLDDQVTHKAIDAETSGSGQEFVPTHFAEDKDELQHAADEDTQTPNWCSLFHFQFTPGFVCDAWIPEGFSLGKANLKLPLAPKDTPWHFNTSDQAEVLGEKDNPNWKRYQAAHLWWDTDHPEQKGSYKLPMARMINGRLQAVWRGITSALAAVQGARGGVNIPATDRERVLRAIRTYYQRFGEDFPLDQQKINLLTKSEDERLMFKSVDDEKRIVSGPVLIPNQFDKQNDRVSVEEIEKAATEYMLFYQQTDINHDPSLDEAAAQNIPIGSMVLKADVDFYGNGEILPKGTWILDTFVGHDPTWNDVKAGRIQGYSIVGLAFREVVSST